MKISKIIEKLLTVRNQEMDVDIIDVHDDELWIIEKGLKSHVCTKSEKEEASS